MTIVMVAMWKRKLAEKYLISHRTNISSLVLLEPKITQLQTYLAVAMAIEFRLVSIVHKTSEQVDRCQLPWLMSRQSNDIRIRYLVHNRNYGPKGTLHQGLKVKKVNNFSNFKSVVSELCRISL